MSRKVLFVCSGNIFRSVIAEYCLKKFLKDNDIKDWEVSSSGTSENAILRYPYFNEKMEELGMGEIKNHLRRQLTKEHIKNNEFVIGMSPYHRDFIKTNFGYSNVYLFTELAGDGSLGVCDIGETEGDTRSVNQIIDDTINYICNKTPVIFNVLSKI